MNDISEYYETVDDTELDGLSLFAKYHHRLKSTHLQELPYFISKDLYLYTWVDLYPDGTVKSIYSGEEKNPEFLIIQDDEIIRKKYEEFQRYLYEVNGKEKESLKELKAIEWKYKFNTEHIVPQSWFGGSEPMKGDLHHLFTCDPECNIARSNFPYEDFSFYSPETDDEPIHNQCGVAANELFEPEHGKGAVARAMLYFMLRYPNGIHKSFRNQINLPLLKRWHKDFPVTLYEKHRNQTIYQIQGNRNPFIDKPYLADRIKFPTY